MVPADPLGLHWAKSIPGNPIKMRKYYAPHGGLPRQDELLTNRAVFTSTYAVIPKDVMRDIVTSYLPFWYETRVWIL